MAENTTFGLPQSDAEKVAALTAALAEANAKLLALSAAAQASAEDAAETMDGQGFPKEYVRLEIFPGRDAQDLSYVPLSIGGYAVKVTRGKEVILPKVFVEVLEHAVEDVTIQSEGGIITRPSLRFPYTVRGTATEAEYVAFSAAMRDQGKAAAAARA